MNISYKRLLVLVVCFTMSIYALSAQCNHNLGTYIVEGDSRALTEIHNLCFNSTIKFVHSGDHNFDGDADASSVQGIGYFLFKKQPSSKNGNLSDLFTEFEVLRDGDGQPIGFIGANGRGAAVFNNGEILSVVEANTVYFAAPVLLNDLPEAFKGNFGDESTCSAISGNYTRVRFLKEIQVSVINVSAGNLTIRVTGGMGEISGAYSYEIFNGNETSASLSGNNIVPNTDFSVDVSDIKSLRLKIKDESCEKEIAMSGVIDNPLGKGHVEMGCIFDAKKGDVVRVPLYLEGFENVGFLSLILNFNQESLKFTGFGSDVVMEDYNVSLPNAGEDLQIDSWSEIVLDGSKTEFLWIEFEVIGSSGTFAAINFADPFSQEITNTATQTYFFTTQNCGVYIAPDYEKFNADVALCYADDAYTFSLENAEGIGPYEIEIIGQSGAPSSKFTMNVEGEHDLSNFNSGVFEVIVMDLQGRRLNKMLELKSTPLELNLVVSNPTCGNINGRIELGETSMNVKGLDLIFHNNGQIQRFDYESFTKISDLSPGSYMMEVLDSASGCSLAERIELENKTGPSVTAIYDTSSIQGCDGTQDIEVTLNVHDYVPTSNGTLQSLQVYKCVNGNCSPQSGLPNEQYIKVPYKTTLKTGNYQVRITDFSGCTSSKNVVISPEEGEVFTSTVEVSPVCARNSRGETQAEITLTLDKDYNNIQINALKLTAENGAVFPYENSLKSRMVSTTNQSITLKDDDLNSGRFYGGQYIIQLSHGDFCGEFAETEFEVPEVKFDSIDVQKTNSCGSGQANGTVQIRLVNDQGFDYEVFWDNNGSSAEDYNDGYFRSNLLPQSYNFILREKSSGCRSPLQVVEIKEGAGINLDNIVQPTCPGSADGSFVLSVDEGAMMDSIRIEANGNIIRDLQNVSGQVTISDLVEAQYMIVSSAGECQNLEFEELTSPHRGPDLFNVNSIYQNPICPGESTLINVSSTNVTWIGQDKSKVTFGVNFKDSDNTYGLNENHEFSLSPGINTLYLFDDVCWSKPFEFMVEEPESFSPTLLGDSVIYLGERTTIRTQESENFFVSYTWILGDSLIMGDSEIDLTPGRSGNIRLQVTNLDGCIGEGEFYVLVIDNKEFGNPDVPTIFNPNLGGSNGYFKPLSTPSVDQVLEFKVFDRWGNRVWEDKEISDLRNYAGWDGRTVDGKEAAPGVYIYTVKIRYLDEEVRLFRDHITLVR